MEKKQPYTQDSFPNCERSLDPSTCHHIDFRIRSGTTNSPKRPLSLQKPDPEAPIESVELGDQDGGPPFLPPEEEALFYSRLSKIWEGLMTFPMTADWKDIISSLPSDVWLSRIAEHIPTNVKLILASPQPPALARLKSLGWSDTTDGGVFARRFKPNGKQVSIKKTDSLYIGSASKYPGGLSVRRRRMLLPSPRPQDEALKSKIKCLDLSPEGEFITLFIVPFKNGSNDDVMDVRALVILARTVLMIWLGAVDEGLKPAIKDLVPWGLKNIKYLGLAGDNPLATNFNGRDGAKKRENHKGTE